MEEIRFTTEPRQPPIQLYAPGAPGGPPAWGRQLLPLLRDLGRFRWVAALTPAQAHRGEPLSLLAGPSRGGGVAQGFPGIPGRRQGPHGWGQGQGLWEQ